MTAGEKNFRYLGEEHPQLVAPIRDAMMKFTGATKTNSIEGRNKGIKFELRVHT